MPEEVPVLESKETYGLVKPEEFSYPFADVSPWTKETYLAFDITKATTPDFAVNHKNHSVIILTCLLQKAKRGEKELPKPKEAPIYQSTLKRSNESGCTLM